MQLRFSDEDRHARHLLCVVPSIIVNKALQVDDEVEGMLFCKKDIPSPFKLLKWLFFLGISDFQGLLLESSFASELDSDQV